MVRAFFANLLEPLAYLIYLLTVYLNHRSIPSVKTRVLMLYYFSATALMAYASWYVFTGTNTPESNNNWLYNIFYFISAGLLPFYLYLSLKSRPARILAIVLLVLNTGNFLLNDLVFRRQLFDSNVLSTLVISIILLTFLHLVQMVRNVGEHNIMEHFDFWLMSGYLIYFLGSFFIILSWSYLIDITRRDPTSQQRYLFSQLWSIHNILLFMSSMITLGGSLWIRFRKK